MAAYLRRLAELALAGFIAGASTYLAQNGLDWSSASVRGLLGAAALGAYGVVMKKFGDPERPTLTK